MVGMIVVRVMKRACDGRTWKPERLKAVRSFLASSMSVFVSIVFVIGPPFRANAGGLAVEASFRARPCQRQTNDLAARI